MVDVEVSSSNGRMHEAADALERNQAAPQPGDCTSLEGVSDQESSIFLGLSADSRRDGRQDEPIEKLKEFLSEAACRGDDVVTQNDADTVKALENLQLGADLDTGLGARLESAARANLEIQNQAASGYYPSETVYLEEHTLKEVLEESGAASSVQNPSTVAYPHSPRMRLLSPQVQSSPTRNIDAESDLKNELDCLFQERASRFRVSP